MTTTIADAYVQQVMVTFNALSWGKQVAELSYKEASVLASRASAGGLLDGETREQTDAILAAMTETVNSGLKQPLNLSNPEIMPYDVIEAARGQLERATR